MQQTPGQDGSELKKPDMVHTLYPEEIEKDVAAAVRELFMVGRATAEKLKKINVHTIGDLARSDHHIKSLLKSHGLLVWNYANGIDDSEVIHNDQILQGIGNSTTTKYDISDRRKPVRYFGVDGKGCNAFVSMLQSSYPFH